MGNICRPVALESLLNLSLPASNSPIRHALGRTRNSRFASFRGLVRLRWMFTPGLKFTKQSDLITASSQDSYPSK